MFLNFPYYKKLIAGGDVVVPPDVGPEEDDPFFRGVSTAVGFTGTLPATEVGDLVLAYLTGGSGITAGWTTAPSGWTLVQNSSANNAKAALFYRFFEEGDPVVSTFTPPTGSSNQATVTMITIGAANTSPFARDPEVGVTLFPSNTATHGVVNLVPDEGQMLLAFSAASPKTTGSNPPTGFTEASEQVTVLAGASGSTSTFAYLQSAPAATYSGLAFTTQDATAVNAVTFGVIIRRGVIPPDPNALIFEMDTSSTPPSGDAINFDMEL